MIHDFIVVGAGIAGLSCARELSMNHEVLVLNSGRGVGGRCGTWRLDESMKFDYGISFFHGTTQRFLDELHRIDANRIDGWPRNINGSGTPCQPRAFSNQSWRLAFEDGVSVLPKHLASGLEVVSSATVTSVDVSNVVKLEVETSDAAGTSNVEYQAKHVVIATANEQAIQLIDTMSGMAGIAGIRRLLVDMGSVPCLSLMCWYASQLSDVDWDVMYPESIGEIQLIANENAKRPRLSGSGLVIQATPVWSQAHMDDESAVWANALLKLAVAQMDERVETPVWSRAHRWQYARVHLGTQFSDYISIRNGDASVSFCGESYAPNGGAESAFLSGLSLARKLNGGNNE